MANTYTQLYVQFVFAVKYRDYLKQPEWEGELHKYVTGIIQNHRHKMIAINGIQDHLHVFVGLGTTQSIAEVMQVVKGESSEWINKNKLTKSAFRWQEGYGAFSYSRSHIDRVYQYIINQKRYHEKKGFIEEYMQLLKAFDIPYDERYIFKTPE